MGLIHTADSDGKNQTPVSAANPLPMGGNVGSGAADSGNPVKVAGVFNSTLPTVTNGQRSELQTDSRGNLRAAIVVSSATATNGLALSSTGWAVNNDGHGTNRMLAVGNYVCNGASWDMARKPSGASRIPSSAANTNATSAKTSAGDIHCISGVNTSASVIYLKFYNKASAPTVGTDVPALTIALPASAPFNINLNGHYLGTGIAYGLTTDAADSGATAVASGDILGLTITYA